MPQRGQDITKWDERNEPQRREERREDNRTAGFCTAIVEVVRKLRRISQVPGSEWVASFSVAALPRCTAIDQVARSLRATSRTKGTAEYAEYAENGMDWVPTSAYFAYSAVSAAALPHRTTIFRNLRNLRKFPLRLPSPISHLPSSAAALPRCVYRVSAVPLRSLQLNRCK